ncbi:hypothetical protein BHE74_00058735 [Ensete ventricosum]|nr:hypothetical protein BHE74_00058735 [Ensete ventricosum]
MGQGMSCAGSSYEHGFFSAVQDGHLETVRRAIDEDPSLLRGATIYDRLSALHIAAANGRVEVRIPGFARFVNVRDDNGATPLHLAAKQRRPDSCAALLNPSAAEPLVWPSPLKVISELDPDAKALLEVALTEANKEREKKILEGTKYSLSSPSHWDAAIPDDSSEVLQIPDWIHMQQCVSILVVAKTHDKDEGEKGTTSKLRRSRRSHNFSAESSSFKTSAMGSFSKMGRGSGKVKAVKTRIIFYLKKQLHLEKSMSSHRSMERRRRYPEKMIEQKAVIATLRSHCRSCSRRRIRSCHHSRTSSRKKGTHKMGSSRLRLSLACVGGEECLLFIGSEETEGSLL